MYIGKGNSKIKIMEISKYNEFIKIQNQYSDQSKTMEDFIKNNVNKQNFLRYLICTIYIDKNPYYYIEPLIQIGKFDELIKEIQGLTLDLEVLWPSITTPFSKFLISELDNIPSILAM